MKTEKNTLDDIVFENRNKEYGAYYLRTHYEEHLLKAFFYGISTVLLFAMLMYFWQKTQGHTFSLPKIESGVDIDIQKFLPKEPVAPKQQQVIQQPQIQQKAVNTPVAVADNTKTETPLPDMTHLDDFLIGPVDIEGIPPTDGLGSLTQSNTGPVIEAVEPVKSAEPEKTFEKAEVDPSFMGGTAAMYKYLSSKLQYPNAAQRVNLEGKVFVKFVVEKDGSIANVEVLKGIGFGCDEEAARVVRNMPKWNPGKQNGQNVRVFFTLPIWFKLD